jgi:hypothetical protein
VAAQFRVTVQLLANKLAIEQMALSRRLAAPVLVFLLLLVASGAWASKLLLPCSSIARYVSACKLLRI